MEITEKNMVGYTSIMSGSDSAYTVRGSVRVIDSKLQGVDMGTVTSIANKTEVATFNRQVSNNLNVTFNDGTASQRSGILDSIEAYLTAVDKLTL
ncbi:hypothetical protein [uncultured phage cr112_1]|jgi:hypothetical protein|uniref:Uncharacterized protein n=1 Tax=uncultured phage cr112_1 TaxID=2772072 RepID=A0A7M1RXT4_9CAUD|nr:hypothetical protein KNV39_gp033 [uncultured phage cr112_1]QOR59253.1 hypothetical protein [uncultured phage cr112_1]